MFVYGTCLCYACCSDCVGVCGNVCCVAVVVKDSVLALDYFAYLCKGCDEWCVFCVYVLMYGKCGGFVMQMLYVCVYLVVLLNATFCMTCSLLMLVEYAIGDNMEEASQKPDSRMRCS